MTELPRYSGDKFDDRLMRHSYRIFGNAFT
jgi:hypothetical protein